MGYDQRRSAQRPLNFLWRSPMEYAYSAAIECPSGYAIGVYGRSSEVLPMCSHTQTFSAEARDRIRYAFGHLAAAVTFPKAEHARDSQELADHTFEILGLTDREIDLLVEAAFETAMWAQLNLNGAAVRLGEFR